MGRPHHDVRTSPAPRTAPARGQRPTRGARHHVHGGDRVVARLGLQDVAHQREVLDGVTVGVDHRMVEPGLDAGDRIAREVGHRVILARHRGARRNDARPMDPEEPRVRLERDGNVAVVVLDDPARRNASFEVTTQLAAAVEEAAADPGVGRRRRPPLPGLLRGDRSTTSSTAGVAAGMYAGFLALTRLAIPLVAAVNGPVIAPGSTCPSPATLFWPRRGRARPAFMDLGIHPGVADLCGCSAVGRQAAAALGHFGESLSGEDAAVGLAGVASTMTSRSPPSSPWPGGGRLAVRPGAGQGALDVSAGVDTSADVSSWSSRTRTGRCSSALQVTLAELAGLEAERGRRGRVRRRGLDR